MLSVPEAVRRDPHLRGVAKERMSEAIAGMNLPTVELSYRLERAAEHLLEAHPPHSPRWGDVIDRRTRIRVSCMTHTASSSRRSRSGEGSR